jgi:hypothetical protein
MVEKQWFGCQGDDWTPGFWSQYDISQADLLTIPAAATKQA